MHDSWVERRKLEAVDRQFAALPWKRRAVGPGDNTTECQGSHLQLHATSLLPLDQGNYLNIYYMYM